MAESKKVSRRRFLLYTAVGAIVIGVAAGTYYLTSKPTVTSTPTTTSTLTSSPSPTITTSTTQISTVTSSTTTMTSTRPTGKITTLLHKAPWLEAYKKIIEQYKNVSGNEVVLETVAGIPDLRDKYIADATQGTALYDIYTLVPVIALSLIPNQLYPIEKIHPSYKPDPNIIQHPYGFYKGSNYIFPLNNNPEIIFYRKDLFDEVGLKPPATWDDVVEAAKTLHNPSKEIYGFIPRGSADPITEYTMLRSFGGDWFVDWEKGDFTVRVNDANGLATFETLALLAKYSPPSPNTISQTDIGNYMMSGKGAQTLVVAALATSMDDPKLSKVPNLIDYAPPPKGVAPGGMSTAVDGGFGLGVPLKSKNIPVAIDFAEFCATKEAQYIMAQYGTAPCRMDVLQDPNLLKDPKNRYLKAAAQVIPNQVSWPCIPEQPYIKNTIFAKLVDKVLTGYPVKQALNECAEEIYKYMKEKGYKTSWTPNLWEK